MPTKTRSPEGFSMAVVMPMSSPRALKRPPPEVPGLMAGGARVGAEALGGARGAVGEGDLDVAAAADDVVVGQDASLFVDDDAGADAAGKAVAGRFLDDGRPPPLVWA